MKIKCIMIAGKKRGSTISLTLDEARDLYDSLAEIFGPKEYSLRQEPFIPFTTPYIDPLKQPMYGDIESDVAYSDRTDKTILAAAVVGVTDALAEVASEARQYAEDVDQENR